jgi:hypothetical protein
MARTFDGTDICGQGTSCDWQLYSTGNIAPPSEKAWQREWTLQSNTLLFAGAVEQGAKSSRLLMLKREPSIYDPPFDEVDYRYPPGEPDVDWRCCPDLLPTGLLTPWVQRCN